MKDKLYVLIYTNDFDTMPLAVSYSRKRIYEIGGEKAVFDNHPVDSMQVIEINLDEVEE